MEYPVCARGIRPTVSYIHGRAKLSPRIVRVEPDDFARNSARTQRKRNPPHLRSGYRESTWLT